MELTEQLQLDRKHWIAGLRDPEITKIEGALVGQSQPKSYCAMGVAGMVQNAFEGEGLEYPSIDTIGEMFGLDEAQSNYIVAMNDGGIVYKEMDMVLVNGWAYHEEKCIRNTADKRSFEFIARWLEILFALERIDLASGDKA